MKPQHHLSGTHHFSHKKYEKFFLPILHDMEKKHHLKNVTFTEECWMDDYEGEQIDYVIQADNITSEQVVALSLEIAERLDYSFPTGVTVRFASYD